MGFTVCFSFDACKDFEYTFVSNVCCSSAVMKIGIADDESSAFKAERYFSNSFGTYLTRRQSDFGKAPPCLQCFQKYGIIFSVFSKGISAIVHILRKSRIKSSLKSLDLLIVVRVRCTGPGPTSLELSASFHSFLILCFFDLKWSLMVSS